MLRAKITPSERIKLKLAAPVASPFECSRVGAYLVSPCVVSRPLATVAEMAEEMETDCLTATTLVLK